MRSLTILLALLIALGAVALHQPRVTYACSCVQPGPPAEARAGAAAVFAGKVSAISAPNPADGAVLVTFDLTQSWKGPTDPQLTLATTDNSASCGFAFAQGEEYLVYALPIDGRLSTNLCTRTAPLAAAGADLAALGAGTPVAQAPAEVSEARMETPWLPIMLLGAAVLVGAALFGPALARRRR